MAIADVLASIFEYSFLWRSFVAAILIGSLCSLLGVFVVLKGLSFAGAGIAHGAFAGVAFAFLIGANPFMMGLLFALAMVLMVGVSSKKGNLNVDASIGILFALTMALAILFIGMMKQYNTELFSFLFGNILAVTPEDLHFMSFVFLGVVVVLLIGYRAFYFWAFDEVMAEASGVLMPQVFYLFLAMLALAIVASLKVVGELLVNAFIIIPAASSFQLTYSFKRMALYSVLLGAFASVTGLILSFIYDIPSGASIVIILGLEFLVCTVLSPKKRWHKGKQ
ncbi:MAG: metal ABC transporter permease [Bacillota bacterium]|jgi:zinc transport system permease protein|nr:metal ABC transporter permease [Bacillota bacterium]NLU55584.1 metal ABC transporter permease [Bacillota bacterium]HOP53607.1 metal ABC transporter permease [Bacillota bacterium]HPT60415.1 metal ABC transporter permease [Bacillota bacterium]HPZ73413.1 metal ABC transporter permease [Bacillota bacterium]